MEYRPLKYNDVKRGEIYYILPDEESESVGSEQCNHCRPGIIVSNNVGNVHSGIVEVVYLTTQPKKNLPTHVDIYTTQKKSTALCEQICTVSKYRLDKYVNQCTDKEMEDIDSALMISLGLTKSKAISKYMDRWLEIVNTDEFVANDVKQIIESQEPQAFQPIPEVQYVDGNALILETERDMYKKMYEDLYALFSQAIGGKI